MKLVIPHKYPFELNKSKPSLSISQLYEEQPFTKNIEYPGFKNTDALFKYMQMSKRSIFNIFQKKFLKITNLFTPLK